MKLLVKETYELITHDGNNGKVHVHGVSNSISELIAFYYQYRKHLGYMEVVGSKTRNRFATLGSMGVIQ